MGGRLSSSVRAVHSVTAEVHHIISPQILSLGVGVQSSTLYMMSVLGELHIDYGVFSDTGWEPKAVYDQLDWLKAQNGPPIIVVNGGSLKDDELSTTRHVGRGKYTLIPWYTAQWCTDMECPTFRALCAKGALEVREVEGALVCGHTHKGKLRRICTSRYKIEPVQRWLRKELHATETSPVDLLIGISLDEYQRMRDSRVSYARNVYPLIDLKMTRQDCLNWMEAHSLPQPPKSACIICPFRRDAGWRRMKAKSPGDFQEAVQFDQLLRSGHYTAFRDTAYVHDSRVPLADVPLGEYTPADDEAPQADECGLLCPNEEPDEGIFDDEELLAA